MAINDCSFIDRIMPRNARVAKSEKIFLVPNLYAEIFIFELWRQSSGESFDPYREGKI